jgi:hypothetical protein
MSAVERLVKRYPEHTLHMAHSQLKPTMIVKTEAPNDCGRSSEAHKRRSPASPSRSFGGARPAEMSLMTAAV